MQEASSEKQNGRTDVYKHAPTSLPSEHLTKVADARRVRWRTDKETMCDPAGPRT